MYKNYLMATCPNESAHSGGIDRNPSFRVKIGSDTLSWGQCYACDYSVLMEKEFGSGNDDWWPIRSVRPDLQWGPTTTTNRAFFGKRNTVDIDEDQALKPFVGRYAKYLAERGFTRETARYFRLGFDRRMRRAIFPIWNIDKRLVGISGRTVIDEKPKYLHYCYDKAIGTFVPYPDRSRPDDMIRFKRSELLYGEWIDGEGDLIVVEGFTDVLRLWQCGVRAVGVFGSNANPVQIEKIVRLADPNGRVIVMGDGDKAGHKATQSIARALHERVRVYSVNLPEGKDPGDMTCDEVVEVLNTKVKFFIDRE